MARLEIEINKPADFAETLYYHFAFAWDKTAVKYQRPMAPLPDWQSLSEADKFTWIETVSLLLGSYFRATL